jgi:tetratricopeptide (TPR) repeat protein
VVGEGSPLDDLVARRDEFREAVQALLDAGRGEDAVELAANVWRLWMVTHDPAGGRDLLGPALDTKPRFTTSFRALALYGDGMLALRLGATEQSRTRNEEALAVAQATGDGETLAFALLGLSRVAFLDGDHPRAGELASDALEFAYGLGMRQAPLHILAQATRLGGGLDEAARLFAESLALNRELGDPGMVGVELQNLGLVEAHRGNADVAEALFAEHEATGSQDPYDLAMAKLNGAAVAFARSERQPASRLLALARSAFDQAGIVPADDDQRELDWLAEQLSADDDR